MDMRSYCTYLKAILSLILLLLTCCWMFGSWGKGLVVAQVSGTGLMYFHRHFIVAMVTPYKGESLTTSMKVCCVSHGS